MSHAPTWTSSGGDSFQCATSGHNSSLRLRSTAPWLILSSCLMPVPVPQKALWRGVHTTNHGYGLKNTDNK